MGVLEEPLVFPDLGVVEGVYLLEAAEVAVLCDIALLLCEPAHLDPLLVGPLLPLAGGQPLLDVLVPLHLDVVLDLVGEVEQPQRVPDRVLLDQAVQWGVRGKTGRVVHLFYIQQYLEKQRVELRIQDHVEAQQLEAHVVAEVVWLAGPVRARQHRMPRNKCFYEDVVYLCFKGRNVISLLGEPAVNRSQRPFMSNIHI